MVWLGAMSRRARQHGSPRTTRARFCKGERTVTFTKFEAILLSALASKKGAAMVEYALLAGLIAVVAVTTLTGLGTTISGKFTAISTAI